VTQDPRGRWFRVYARMVRQHPKFRGLNGFQLGAWLVLRSEAELRDGYCFVDRTDAIAALRRRHIASAGRMLDGLIALALFDIEDDGTITVHDRSDHDRQSFPSDDPDEVRKRVERHRRKKAGNDSNESVTNGNDKETTPVRAPSGAGAVSEVPTLEEDSRARDDAELPVGWDAPDAVIAYHEVTGRYPSEKVIEWLNRLSNDHPEEAIAQVLAEEYLDDNNLGTLLSRTDTALKLDQHRRNKADQRARAQALAKAEAPHREREREATPEEREQAKLQQQAIRIGLTKGLMVPTDPTEVRKFVMKHGSAA
jgi:hypothetical protein